MEKESVLIKSHSFNVCAVLIKHHKDGKITKKRFHGKNALTKSGEIYYAKIGARQMPPSDFVDQTNGRLVLRNMLAGIEEDDNFADLTGHLTAKTTDYKPVSMGYPKTDDNDPDNVDDSENPRGGPNIITYLYEWPKDDLVANSIQGGGIVFKSADPPANSDPILNHFDIIPIINKTAEDELRIFINHSINRVDPLLQQ